MTLLMNAKEHHPNGLYSLPYFHLSYWIVWQRLLTSNFVDTSECAGCVTLGFYNAMHGSKAGLNGEGTVTQPK